MKTIAEMEEEICRYDMSYLVRNAALSFNLLQEYKDKLQELLEKAPKLEPTVLCHQIKVRTENREDLMTFLQVFGGDWNKEVDDYCPDKLNYFRKEKTPSGREITILAEGAPPPPSCQIVEEEVEVPARKEKRKRIVCEKEEEVQA